MQKRPPREHAVGTLHSWRPRFGLRVFLLLVAIAAVASYLIRLDYLRPPLELRIEAPETTIVGQTLSIDLVLTNNTDERFSSVLINVWIPDGLTHEAGDDLEYNAGAIAPGEDRKVSLTVKAKTPGRVKPSFVVQQDGEEPLKQTVQLNVIAARK